MLDRRTFCLAYAASVLAQPLSAQAASAPEDARLAAISDRFFATALDESPTLVTSLGLDTGSCAAAKSNLDDQSPAALERAKRRIAAQLVELAGVGSSRLGSGPIDMSVAI